MGYGCIRGTWRCLWVPGKLYVWVLGTVGSHVGSRWHLGVLGTRMDPAGRLLVLEVSVGSEGICGFQGDLEISERIGGPEGPGAVCGSWLAPSWFSAHPTNGPLLSSSHSCPAGLRQGSRGAGLAHSALWQRGEHPASSSSNQCWGWDGMGWDGCIHEEGEMDVLGNGDICRDGDGSTTGKETFIGRGMVVWVGTDHPWGWLWDHPWGCRWVHPWGWGRGVSIGMGRIP